MQVFRHFFLFCIVREDMKKIQHHFSKIAPIYRDKRTTDTEHISHIVNKLKRYEQVTAADVGCGAGRYDLQLFLELGNKLKLYCVDSNKDMLHSLSVLLKGNRINNFKTVVSPAHKLPIDSNKLDCVLTFNAVHHFQLVGFLKESFRVLKEGGYLFIYTRLRSQNRRNIWGKYFPLFNKKENRLFEVDELRFLIEMVPGLVIESTRRFKYYRNSGQKRLVEQAQSHHYSTFALFTKREFLNSLRRFKINLTRHFSDTEDVHWIDENILFVIRKRKLNKGKTTNARPETI